MSLPNPFHLRGNPYMCAKCWGGDHCKECQIKLAKDTWKCLSYYLPEDHRVLWKMERFVKTGFDYFNDAQQLFNDYKKIVVECEISSATVRMFYVEMRKLSMHICHYVMSLLNEDDKQHMEKFNSAIKLYETTYYWSQIINHKWSSSSR